MCIRDRDGTARIWDVAQPVAPLPNWLPGLVEVLAGQRLEEVRITYPSLDEFWAIRAEVLASPARDECASWAKSLLQESERQPFEVQDALGQPSGRDDHDHR